MRAGEHLRGLRARAGLATRDVADFSQRIAAAETNEEYGISHARLIQIENDESTPSVYKLYTLSLIYGVAFDEIVSLYVDLAGAPARRLNLGLAQTRLADFASFPPSQTIPFPVRFDPGFKVDHTNLLSRVVEVWGQVPAGLLHALNIRQARYGFIGLEDYTMYPLLRPGSFVQIEEATPRPEPGGYRSEYERPLWFLELRDGYVCSWCELKRDRIISVPHPLSPCTMREFAYPRDVHVVGRVTAVAARIADPAPGPPTRGARSPEQS
jgi:transcriptional regulator with XRE-family HTH domain